MERSPPTSMAAAMGRLAWMILCPMGLLLLTLSIILKIRGWFTVADSAYFIVLGVALFGRWLEFKGGDPRTASNEPAMPAHLHRYLIVAPLLGIGTWVLAKLLGNYVVTAWQ